MYLLAVLLPPGLLIYCTPTPLRGELAVAGVTGLVMWSLIEYAMHRFVYHGVEPFQRLHAEHHRRPLALIATATLVSVSLIVVLVWLPAILLVGFWLGSGTTLGVTIGYFVYGVLHHGVHHWRAKGSWMRQCKRQHAIHHHNPGVNFGVTMLWWDRAFDSSKSLVDNL